MGLEIYLDLLSQPCRAVYMFARATNIPFEFKKISLMAGDQHSEEFSKVNILKKVPAIRDGDFCLAESIAIMTYLAEKYKTPDHWYPADLQKRARVNEFMSWQHTTIRPDGGRMLWLKVMIPKVMGAEAPQEKVDAALEDLDGSLKLFEEKFLQDRRFIAGDQISLADLVAIVAIMQPLSAAVDVFKTRPKLTAWKDRVREAVGADLFDEAHRDILSAQDLVKNIDGNRMQHFKARILKVFL